MDSHLRYWNAICYDMPSYAMTCSGNLSYNSYSATREARWSVLLGTLVHLVPWRMTMSYHSGLIIHVEIKSISPPNFLMVNTHPVDPVQVILGMWLFTVNNRFTRFTRLQYITYITPGFGGSAPPQGWTTRWHRCRNFLVIPWYQQWRDPTEADHEIGMDSAEAWGSDPNREILQGDLCLMAQFILNPNTHKNPS